MDLDVLPQNPGLDRVNADKKRHAQHVVPRVVSEFNSAMVSGEVKSAFSRIGGGGLTPIDPIMWRTDDPMLRFRTFSYDPADPFSENISLPCWLWIDLPTLRAAMDRRMRDRLGWGPPTPTPPLPRTETYTEDDGSVTTVHYLADGGIKITSSADALPPAGKGKAGRPDKTSRILKLFADHLRAGNVAERASWEGEKIRREYGGDSPPKAATCAERIRKYFNMILRDEDGRIVNVAQILTAMNYPINPDKCLSFAMK
jgi:hypothetical protein